MVGSRFPNILTVLSLLNLVYRSVYSQCSGTVNITVGETPQTISSENFPNNYPNTSRVCEWRLTTEANYTEILMVHNVKTLNAGDMVEIFPGCDPSSPNKVEHNSLDSDILADSNFISPVCIKFTVSSGSSNTGFQETFIAFPKTVAESVCNPATVNDVIATTTPLYLYNPEFPAQYSENQDCSWRIQNGGTGKDIILTVEIMSLEKQCVDNVTIQADGEASGTTYCLTDVFITPFSLRNSSFLVSFHSDNTDGFRGFVISYVLEEPCTGVVTTLQAQPSISYQSSIGYPSHYQSAAKSGPYSCTWQIEPGAAQGLLLSLTVDQLTDGDTLFIYEGTSDKTGTLLFPGQGDNYNDPCYFCNKSTILVSASSAFIEFNVSSSGNAGFNLGYLSQASSSACNADAETSPLSLIANDTIQYFSSPFFNTSYPGSECYWNISDGDTGRGVILTVEFAYFGTDCSDYLVITGHDSSASSVCSGSIDFSPIVYKKNYFQIKYNSSQHTIGKGFSISYILDAPCKGTVTMLTPGLPITLITSPGYPSPYPGIGRSGGYVCKWHIEAQTNNTGILIKYSFDALQRGDTIAFYEGCDSNGAVKFISNNNSRQAGNNALLTFQGSAYIELTVISSTGDSGLRMWMTSQMKTNNTVACGANGAVVIATEEVQYFTSTNFPEKYEQEQCLWQISDGNSGNTVVLTVEFYDIEDDGGCLDVLTIEGPATNSTQICGQQFTHPLRTFRDTNFNVSFSSNDGDVFHGFVFSVVLEKPCTPTVPTMLVADVNVQSFSSLGYPNNYAWNRQSGDYVCEWQIKASDMSAGILLYLDIGGLSSGTTLNIYSGCDNTGPKLYPAIGTDPTAVTPSVQTTIATGNCTFIEFNVTSEGGQGFQIQYLSVPASDNTDACAASAVSPVTREANDTVMYLTSSDFPDPYPPSSECYWNITDGDTDRGVILTVEFNHFATSCDDYVMITEGSGTESTKVCSDNFNTSPMVFKNSSFQIMFKSDASNNASGFVISYILDAPCKGTVTNINADLPITTITSPGYPSPYPGIGRSGGYVCKWHIEARTNNTGILIRYDFGALQRGDTLALYEGCDSNGVLKFISNNGSRQAGNNAFLTFQGSAYIELSVTSSTGDLGLRIRMTSQLKTDNTAACGANGAVVVATEEVQYFTSTNFPQKYEQEECLWAISSGNPMENVVLTVEFYDIEDDGGCLDPFTVDGPATNSTTICGQQFSHPLRTFRDTNLNVSFSSSDGDVFHGFVFSVVLEKPCTPTVPTMLVADVNVQSFSSLGYPNNYTWNRQSGDYVCEWHITASDMSAGILLYLDIGGLSSGTTLNVYSGCDNTGPKLYPASGTDPTAVTPSVQTTIATGNCTFIEFNVTSEGGQGFQIQYLSVPATDNTDACAASAVSPVTREANDTLMYLTSSNFPDAYPPSLDCYWNITDGDTGRGVILTVEFKHFATSCDDYIMITGGSGTESSKVCSDNFNASPMVFKNSSFQIMFKSDASNNASGFVISFILDAPCKGTVTNINADLPITTITSPGYPSPYPGIGRSGGYVCKWHIEAKTSDTGILIRYDFGALQRGDTIAFYEGCDSNGAVKFISNNNTRQSGNNALLTFQGSAYIELSVTSLTGDLGLRIRMTSQLKTNNTQACGANGAVVIATKEVQYFTSTNFPEKYEQEQCLWAISSGNPAENVVLTVEFYDIEDDGGCLDKLTVDGMTNSTEICGQQFSHPLRTFRDTNLNVSFSSSDGDVFHGFVFSVVLDKPCTSTTPTMLVADVNVQSFSSEGYPNNYTWNRQSGDYVCEWHITASDMSAGILLHLDIGGLSSGTTLNIYSGCDNTGPKLYPAIAVDPTLATSSVQTVIATGNCTFIEFSVSSEGGQGFQIQYLSVPASDNTDACAASAVSPVTREANETVMYLTSSDFPDPYPPSLDCYWNITDGDTGRGVILTVEFNHFDTSCDDYVMITEGSGTESSKVCSDNFNASPMVFKNSSFQIMFKSDGSNNASGFVISYILDAPCKGTVTNINVDLPITTITSPGYPSPYPGIGRSGGYVCKWHIEAKTSNTGILIRYDFGALQRGDTIAFYEGCDSNGVEKFISNNNTRQAGNNAFLTFQGSAYIEFSVTSLTGDLGLRIRMTSQLKTDNTQACGSNGAVVIATEEVQYFTSTNFPEKYEQEQCLWQISGGNSGNTVVLTVEFYDIEDDGGCLDVLTIEGPATNTTQICGQQFSHPLRTFRDTNLNVSFSSSDGDVFHGFVFSVVLEKPCTPTVPTMLVADVNVQSFSSVGYPNNYTWNRQSGNYQCEWHIEASDGSAGILLDLHMGGLSIGTQLNIYDGCDNTGTKLYPTINGPQTTTERTQIATGNSTFIEFTVTSVGGQGFLINYLSIPASDNSQACSGNAGLMLNATDTLQYITSNNFPQLYSGNMACKWQLQDGATGRGVFMKLYLNHIECTNDKLDITGADGTTTKCSDELILSPENFTSDSLVLDFLSNANIQKHGFVLSYILGPPCNGSEVRLVGNENIQELTSPLYPGNYPSAIPIGSYECYWFIESSDNVANLLIAVEIENLSAGDTLEIFQGNVSGTRLYPAIGADLTLGTGATMFELSPGKSTLVKFSVTSSANSGFVVRYVEQRPVDTAPACSASNLQLTATSSPAYLTSPNFPDDYPHNQQCTWSIDDGGSHRGIILQLLLYQIQNATNCADDELAIRKGPTLEEVKRCSDTLVTTTENFTDSNFEIYFKTNPTIAKTGFQLRYIIDAPCNGSVIELNSISALKQLISPEYPAYPGTLYSGPYTCFFVITPQGGASGNLMSFNLSGIDFADSITIYDGTNSSGTVLYPTNRRKRSTGITNQVFVSNSGTSAFIEFNVNSPAGSTGFVVDYISHPATNNTDSCSNSIDQLVATSTIQYITSTNFPSVYPRDQNCIWNISNGISGIDILFTLITYQIQEQGSACDGDKLNIKQGPSRTPNVRCSNSLVLTQEDFKSSSFEVEFTSDGTTAANEHGFLFSYILYIPCQGGPTTLSADVNLKNFSSPEYPSNYPSTAFIGNYTCNWLIEATETGAGILLILNMDGLNAGDTLFIYSGNSDTGTRLYPTTIDLQSNTSAAILHFAPGSSAFVSFTANTTANKGFHITYMAIKPSNTTVACANNAVLPLIASTTVQYITTPNFPQMYTSGLSCRWTISRGNVNADVILTVIILHTESDVCTNDTLVIKGEGESAIDLCSDQVSTTAREYRSRSFTIEFDTNNADNNRGFVISYLLGPEEPTTPRYTRSEKIGIAIAASVGPAVIFLVLAIVTIACCFRNRYRKRQRKPRQRRSLYENGGYMNGQLSGVNSHSSFNKHDLVVVKTDENVAPTWVKMFRAPPSTPYTRYDRPHST